MTVIPPLPTLPVSRALSATVGPPVPGAAALGDELRRTLPPSLVEALDKIGDQIAAEILSPLLCAPSVAELADTFERAFPKFRDYYVSTVLILVGFLEEDVHRLSALTIASFHESEDLIRSSGLQWIGPAASSNALHGLSTIIRVARATTKLFDPDRFAEFKSNPANVEEWADSLIAYAMAFSAVRTSLSALTNGDAASGRLENVATLAHWSKRYAVHAYHLTKVIGLLRPAPCVGPVDPGDEEDLILADAGLESYLEGLRQDDLP
jgi:hypothetical protein